MHRPRGLSAAAISPLCRRKTAKNIQLKNRRSTRRFFYGFL